MRIYVVTLSDQLLANLIPILMDPPDRVVALLSNMMQGKGKDQVFADILQTKGIAFEARFDAPDADFRTIKAFSWQIAETLESQYPDAEIVLNATGGNKLMTLGLVEAFQHVAPRIEYTDTAHRTIEVLHPEPSLYPMRQVLDVPTYLAAQGFRYLRAESDDEGWRQRADQRKAAAKFLGRHTPELGLFFFVLNGMVNEAIQKKANSRQVELANPTQRFHEDKPPYGIWQKALQELEKAKIIAWSAENPLEVLFLGLEEAQFVRGGWLEEYAWHILQDEKLADVRKGIRGTWKREGDSKNEFDVLAVHENVMLYVECKTGQEDYADLSYKTDSLGRSIKGPFGESWILSAQEPSEELHKRAQHHQFLVVGPQEIPHLRQKVQQWRDQRKA